MCHRVATPGTGWAGSTCNFCAACDIQSPSPIWPIEGAVKRSTSPLFHVDPGWLFVAAGLVVCAAGIIIPAQEDLQALRVQLEQLRAQELHAYARLKAHSDFMDQVDSADPALVRRLAAAQLNLVPARDTPLLLTASQTSPVTDWIEATVNPDIRPPKPAPLSSLGQLANGPYRLWLFGGGIMAVFVGLMLGPSPLPASLGRSHDEDALLVDGEDGACLATIEPKPASTACLEFPLAEELGRHIVDDHPGDATVDDASVMHLESADLDDDDGAPPAAAPD